MFTSGDDTAQVNSVAAPNSDPPDGRQRPRTHLFVSATLYAGGGSSPVHIRNMSQSGALIEAASLPDVGERIRLKRGQLEATGWIAWRVGRKAGLRLEAAVHVAHWMARQVSTGQERVDALLSIVRNDADEAGPVPLNGAARLSIEAELGQLRAELKALEAGLLGDVIVVATHPEIQTIDIALQRIDRMLKQLCSGG